MSDHEYYLIREHDERVAAAAATHPDARAIHLQLADLYAAKAAASRAAPIGTAFPVPRVKRR